MSLTMPQLLELCDTALKSVQLKGWLAKGLQPRMSATLLADPLRGRACGANIGAKLTVSPPAAEGDRRRRELLIVETTIVQHPDPLRRPDWVQVGSEIASRHLGKPRRYADTPDDIRRLVCEAGRDLLAFFLLHELGEHLYVGDRRPWYPAADHGDDVPVPDDAGWGPS